MPTIPFGWISRTVLAGDYRNLVETGETGRPRSADTTGEGAAVNAQGK